MLRSRRSTRQLLRASSRRIPLQEESLLWHASSMQAFKIIALNIMSTKKLNVCSAFSLCAPPVRARTGQFAGFAALRSALHSYRTFTTRGRYLLTGAALTVMYCKYIPCVTIISGTPVAANKASLRVQSERSGEVPPLSIRGACTPRVLPTGARTGQLAAVAPLCTHTEHLFLSVFTLLTGAPAFCFPRLLFRSRLKKLPFGCRVSGANDYAN